MKHIFSFILGALLMVAIGAFAQSSGIQIFKPATPKQVMVKSHEAQLHEIAVEIQSVAVKGWLIKSVNYGRSSGNDDKVIVVYEKY